MATDQELMEEAAERLQELDDKLAEAYAELSRIYPIASILHNVVLRFLENPPEANGDEEQEALDLIKDACYAIENGVTIERAAEIREEDGA